MSAYYHELVPMGAKVFIVRGDERFGGVVKGVAHKGLWYTYIIALDFPIPDEDYGSLNYTIAIGTELESEDGSNWRKL